MKLKAFTIIELIIGMLLSGLTIGFAFAVLGIITRMHKHHGNQLSQKYALEKLNVQLSHDISQSEYIKEYLQGITMELDSHTVVYQVVENAIIRQQGLKFDTIFFDKLSLSTKRNDQVPNLVDYVLIEGSFNKEVYKLGMGKAYDAFKLVNQ